MFDVLVNVPYRHLGPAPTRPKRGFIAYLKKSFWHVARFFRFQQKNRLQVCSEDIATRAIFVSEWRLRKCRGDQGVKTLAFF